MRRGAPYKVMHPRIEAASDHSLLVTFGSRIDVSLNQEVHRLFQSLNSRAARGVINLHPAYSSLLIDFDPLVLPVEELENEVGRRLADSALLAAPTPRLVDIPVCYGGEFGPDLEAVAAHCCLTAAQVVERHTAPEYLVYFLGFSPGFPYLGGLDPALGTPRLENPRKSVPAGSVAIGGLQTGIYPLSSPGGWRIIGRTRMRLFDPSLRPPEWLHMGDRLRFRPVRPNEFAELESRS